MKTTQIMNKIAVEHESIQSKPVKQTTNECCIKLQELLNLSKTRCNELKDIVANLEKDNISKGNATLAAIKKLDDYKIGKDGLEQLLKNNAELQGKVQSREKNIQSLVMELNALQYTAEENFILR